jgi:hypothetical protein
MTLAGLLVAAGGCAAKKPVARSGPGYAASGSVAYGTFVKRGEAQLKPPSPLASLDFVGDTLLGKTDRNAVYSLSGGLDIRYIQQVAEPGILVRKPLPYAKQVIFPLPTELKFLDERGDTKQTVHLPYPITTNVNNDPRGFLLAGTAANTGGRVTVIDPKNAKKPIREDTLIGPVLSAPVGFQGVVYVATDRGQVFAIGDERRASWPLPDGAFKTDRSVTADLVIDDYAVYVAATDSKLYALDRTSGRIKWRYMAETGLVDAPFVTGDRVYQVVPNLGVVALSKTLPEIQEKPYREPLWTAKGVTRVLGTDDKFLYAVVGRNTVAAIDLATGETRFDLKGDFEFFAIGADKTIYTADKAGRVLSFARAAYTGEGDVAAAR